MFGNSTFSEVLGRVRCVRVFGWDGEGLNRCWSRKQGPEQEKPVCNAKLFGLQPEGNGE